MTFLDFSSLFKMLTDPNIPKEYKGELLQRLKQSGIKTRQIKIFLLNYVLELMLQNPETAKLLKARAAIDANQFSEYLLNPNVSDESKTKYIDNLERAGIVNKDTVKSVFKILNDAWLN